MFLLSNNICSHGIPVSFFCFVLIFLMKVPHTKHASCFVCGAFHPIVSYCLILLPHPIVSSYCLILLSHPIVSSYCLILLFSCWQMRMCWTPSFPYVPSYCFIMLSHPISFHPSVLLLADEDVQDNLFSQFLILLLYFIISCYCFLVGR